jgi:hypothetical protein
MAYLLSIPNQFHVNEKRVDTVANLYGKCLYLSLECLQNREDYQRLARGAFNWQLEKPTVFVG